MSCLFALVLFLMGQARREHETTLPSPPLPSPSLYVVLFSPRASKLVLFSWLDRIWGGAWLPDTTAGAALHSHPAGPRPPWTQARRPLLLASRRGRGPHSRSSRPTATIRGARDMQSSRLHWTWPWRRSSAPAQVLDGMPIRKKCVVTSRPSFFFKGGKNFAGFLLDE